MKRVALAAVAATVIFAGPALSADLRRSAVPYSPAYEPFSWTGFYVGAHIGGGWSQADWNWAGNGSGDSSGFIGGGQIGYNYQFGQWVVGVEGDMSWTDLGSGHDWGGTGWSGGTDVNWIATVTARLGYAFDRTLIYVKGGAAFADVDRWVAYGGDTVFRDNDTRSGWTLGAGVEWAFAPNWSTKLEYNYLDFGGDHARFSYLGNANDWSSDQQIHAVKLGINYRF
jgi:outer membrane immunogenic protein